MYGQGILRGLGITLAHFFRTYLDDLRYGFRKYAGNENFAERQGPKSRGSFTVQYPDEKLAVPERFRFIPFLIVEDYDHPERPGHDWCTSCGICAKVCPPQCIWIVRGTDPQSGRPKPEPEAFFIDIDICMNCGYCAEFCPFDAIKMDHDYELASYDRTSEHIFDKEKLSKELRYWRTIAPTTAYEEMLARGGWEHTDVLKQRKKEARGAEKIPRAARAAAEEAGAGRDNGAAAAAASVDESLATSTDENLSPEQARRLQKRQEMQARLAARRAAKKSESG